MAKLLSVEMNQPMEINDRTRIREKPPPPNRKLGKRTGRVRNQTSRLQTRWSDPAAAQRLSSTSFMSDLLRFVHVAEEASLILFDSLDGQCVELDCQALSTSSAGALRSSWHAKLASSAMLNYERG